MTAVTWPLIPRRPLTRQDFSLLPCMTRGGWIYTEDGILNEFNMSLNDDGSFDAYFGECGDVENNPAHRRGLELHPAHLRAQARGVTGIPPAGNEENQLTVR